MPQIGEIEFLEGPQAGETVRLSASTMRLGRAAECEIRVEDDFASRHHADIVPEADGFVYVNRSANGTRINGRTVRKRRLRDGDLIEIGTLAKMRFVVHAQPTAVIGHAHDAHEALDDLLTDDETEAPAPRPKAAPSILMRPKVLAALGVYLVAIAAAAVWLSTWKSGAVPEPTFLTREKIIAILDRDQRRSFNVVLAQQWLEKGRRLANNALRDPNYLFASFYAFKESLWAQGLTQFESYQDQQRFEQVREALIRELDGRYFEARKAYEARRWNEAAQKFQAISELMRDDATPALPTFENNPLYVHVRECIAAARDHANR